MVRVSKAKRFLAASLLAASALGLTVSQESQAGYLYTLDNVVFDDNTTATGSFTIGEAYGYLETWNITTVLGTFSGNNYTPAINANHNPLATEFIFQRLGYNGYLQLTFANALWAEGPYVQPASTALLPGYSFSYECSTYATEFGDCPRTYRTVVSGSVTSGAASVPEPGTLALLGLGLAGIGFARRKRAA